jgi:DNA-binding beta-propeller fold protein YncE
MSEGRKEGTMQLPHGFSLARGVGRLLARGVGRLLARGVGRPLTQRGHHIARGPGRPVARGANDPLARAVAYRRAGQLPALLVAAAAIIAVPAVTVAAPGAAFTLFESGQVRPLALSPSGLLLFAVNTPDNRLEIFRVGRHRLEPLGSVQVGLEPVAVAARSDREVWVVNHLSDSVSIVDVALPGQPRVTRTLLVGDEPRDVVFAGPGRGRAFITAAHRGQNAPFDPQLLTPGIGRADVWVFDARVPGDTLGGVPLAIVSLFTDSPRALAVSPDGRTVYAAGLLTGNATSTVSELVLPDDLRLPPLVNHAGAPQPKTGLIVKLEAGHWHDALGRRLDPFMTFNLPDKDVFAIDAMANPPVLRRGEAGFFSGVGTVLYNLAVNPVTGRVYVSNTDARNLARFTGPETTFGPTLRGRFAENRITVLDPRPKAVRPRHLNKHIDYTACCQPIPNDENARSLALPTGMVVSRDGRTLYIAALGSSKVAALSTAALESDSFVPSAADHIAVSGGGPTGLVLDERHGQLLVLTRFDNAIAIVDARRRAEIGKVRLHNPEPDAIVRGRRYLYDAAFSSSRGDSACATCHVFGDADGLAWDLGRPDADARPNANPVVPSFFAEPVNLAFQPLPGPLGTQSLRGMANHGALGWRGDRSAAISAPNVQPDGGAYDERAALAKFQERFANLLGRHAEIPEAAMRDLGELLLEIVYPPNPIRALDNSLSAEERAGRDFYFTRRATAGVNRCIECHPLDPAGNAALGARHPGFFGTVGSIARTPFSQAFKMPHFRNMYAKVGMFGFPAAEPFFQPIPGHDGFLGDQIRGFGYGPQAHVDTILRIASNIGFNQIFPYKPNPEGFAPGPASLAERIAAAKFLFVFDTNLPPIVGQQVTLTADNAAAAAPRLALFMQRADAGECALIVKGVVLGRERGWLYGDRQLFQPDERAAPAISATALHALAAAPRQALTYTCVPPGSGARLALDRDADAVLDGDERPGN